MTDEEAIDHCKSGSAFSSRDVDATLLRRILGNATQTPNGRNLQPWRLHLVGGQRLNAQLALMVERGAADPTGEKTDFNIYPRPRIATYRNRTFEGAFSCAFATRAWPCDLPLVKLHDVFEDRGALSGNARHAVALYGTRHRLRRSRWAHQPATYHVGEP